MDLSGVTNQALISAAVYKEQRDTLFVAAKAVLDAGFNYACGCQPAALLELLAAVGALEEPMCMLGWQEPVDDDLRGK